MSGGASDIAVDISHALGESLSEICALYFRDSDMGNEVDQVLVQEQEHLREDLQMREEFDEGHRQEHEQEIHSYYKDNTF
jgi:hypothetical protein